MSSQYGDGSATFENESTLLIDLTSIKRIDISPTGATIESVVKDKLNVEGALNINGANLAYRAVGNEDLFKIIKDAANTRSKRELAHAAGGVFGTFNHTPRTGYALFNSTLTYSATDVHLGFEQTSFDSLGTNYNQKQTAYGLESTGENNSVYNDVLRTKDGQDITPLFEAISGEIYASTHGYLLSMAPNTLSAAGDRLHSLSIEKDDTKLSSNKLWGYGYGSWSKTDRTDNSLAYRNSSRGVITGLDGMPTDDWQAGLIFGVLQSDVKSAHASNSINSLQFGLYSGTDWNGISLNLAAAYNRHELSTDKKVSGRTHLNADYSANSVLASLEASYRMKAGSAYIEPFANLSLHHLSTGSFSEKGDADYALNGSSGNYNLFVTSLGVRVSQEIDIGSNFAMRLNGSAQWRYSAGDTKSSDRFHFNDGISFENIGSPISTNSAAFSARVELELSPQASFKVDYVGDVSRYTTNHGAQAKLQMKF